MTRYEAPLLRVRDLSIGFASKTGILPAVENLDFEIRRGQTLGIVGESGSGKSLSSLALMGLLPASARIIRGEAHFAPEGAAAMDLLRADEQAMQAVRGKRIAMVFQEPMTSLNPLHTCGDQVAEVMRWHENISRKDAHQRVIALFDEVKLPRPKDIFNSYPHQLSGGQKQRVMIAMALACSPDLLIADEPSTALDVTVQKRILELLNELREKNNMGMIFISHDLGVVAQVAHEVLVLYRGKTVESGKVEDIFNKPRQLYTKALLDCRPRPGQHPKRLPTVADYLNLAQVANVDVALAPPLSQASTHEPDILLEARDINVWYPTSKNAWGKPTSYLKAVDGVSLQIKKGETLGLVGESGCGKSTLGRALLRLQHMHSGSIRFDGKELSHLTPSQMRPLRRRMQLIFQDPYGSLNPRLTVQQALIEPMQVHKLGGNTKAKETRIAALLDRVGLAANAKSKYPHEFSGGQRQRICIARALVVEPDFIVCDESVSALDVSVQAQVINLLNELKEDLGLTYLFISHDLSVVQYMSDHVAVMQGGRIEEYASARNIYENPQSAYTRSLIEAIPVV
jgi:peptide/nickel transport system ATP-binding protein